jgi:hypothetical protein
MLTVLLVTLALSCLIWTLGNLFAGDRSISSLKPALGRRILLVTVTPWVALMVAMMMLVASITRTADLEDVKEFTTEVLGDWKVAWDGE